MVDWVEIGHCRLACGDNLDVMRTLESNSVDSVVTDPPAGIAFMGKDWDHSKGSRDAWVAWMTEVASECLRILKPGGHAFVWSLPRTSHWTATAWENAGFELRDRVAHVFGSGFPKSHNVSIAIDKAAGAEREVVGVYESPDGTSGGRGRSMPQPMGWDTKIDGLPLVTASSTDAAKQWDGWGTALKPAVEDWWLMRKPLVGTVAENVLAHGTGGINIDACRVGDFVNTTPPGTDRFNQANYDQGYRPGAYQGNSRDGESSANKRYADKGITNFAATPGPRGGCHAGRWPANLLHDGSESVVAMFPSDAGGGNVTGTREAASWSGGGGWSGFKSTTSHDDSGSAARFFYAAKASRADRNDGCDAMPLLASGTLEDNGGDFKTGSGNVRDTKRRNTHPTVKPQSLMRWLCRLITPPNGLVLDPFAGSFSTAKACVLEGFRFVGCDQSQEYVDIGIARVRHAVRNLSTGLFDDPAPDSVGEKTKPPIIATASLFGVDEFQ